MSKYKNIKSVAHNIGHSFVSDMNFVGTDRPVTMVPDAIFKAARAAGRPLVRIDLVNGTVEPPALVTAPILKAVASYSRWLPKLAESQAVEPRMIAAATLTLRFDFAGTRASRYNADHEIPAVECLVEIVDDRGMKHVARPEHWCYS